MDFNGITDTGLSALAKGIAHSRLVLVDLNNNNITGTGVIDLADAIDSPTVCSKYNNRCSLVILVLFG